jgi:FkbM family methyltransferase
VKEFIRRIVLAAGYEIHHKSVATSDPFRQQSILLSGVSSPVIFDVGANTGTIAEKYRSVFPSATIYAFEPFGETFKELERKVRGDKRIIATQLALGSAQATQILHSNASPATNSLLETEDSAGSFWGKGLLDTATTVEVDVSTVDEFSRRHEIDFIDVIKIDTQGTEHEVLKGAAEMLSRGRIRVIYTEMIVVPSYKGQSKPHELMGFLDAFGYVLSGIYNLASRNDGRLLQMDAVFIKSPSIGQDPRNA